MIILIPLLKLSNFDGGTNLFRPFDYMRRGCGLAEK